jgi:hypothetical protein
MSFFKRHSDTKRQEIRFSLSDRSLKRLETLKEKTDSETYAQVFQNSLRLLDACIEWAERGNRFAIITQSGDVVPVDVFAYHAPDEAGPKQNFTVIDGGKLPD